MKLTTHGRIVHKYKNKYLNYFAKDYAVDVGLEHPFYMSTLIMGLPMGFARTLEFHGDASKVVMVHDKQVPK